MNSERKFRDKLKGLLEEQTYTYEEFNWDNARKVLDKEDEKRRRGFFFWVLCGSGILTALLFWYFLGTVEQQVAVTALKENTKESYSENKPNITKESNPVPKELQEIKPEAKQLKKEPEQKEIETTKVSEPESSVEPTRPESVAKNLQNLSSGFLRFARNDGSIEPQKETQAQITSGANEDRTKKYDNEKTQKVTEAKESLRIPETSKENTPPTKRNGVKQDENSSVLTQTSQKDSSNSAKITPPEKSSLSATSEKVTVQEPLITKQETPVAKTDSIVSADSSLVKKTNQTLTDSVKSIVQPSVVVNPPLNYFYIEAGTYLNIGWNVNDKHEGLGFNPYFGLNYVFQLSDKTSVIVGASYYTINRLKTSKTIKSTQVVFGEVSDVTEITPTRFNYIAIPIKFQYNLNEKEVLTVGASFAYLLDVQSRVRTYHEAYNAVDNESTHWTGGYREGIKTFNNQINLGYRRKLYQNLWVNAEFLLGFSDLRDNNFFNVNKKETANGFKLCLTYNLIKK